MVDPRPVLDDGRELQVSDNHHRGKPGLRRVERWLVKCTRDLEGRSSHEQDNEYEENKEGDVRTG